MRVILEGEGRMYAFVECQERKEVARRPKKVVVCSSEESNMLEDLWGNHGERQGAF